MENKHTGHHIDHDLEKEQEEGDDDGVDDGLAVNSHQWEFAWDGNGGKLSVTKSYNLIQNPNTV